MNYDGLFAQLSFFYSVKRGNIQENMIEQKISELVAAGSQHGGRVAKHSRRPCHLTGIVDAEINTSCLKSIGVATTSAKG